MAGSPGGRRKNGAGSVYPIRSNGAIVAWCADVQVGSGPTAQRIKRRAPTEQAAEELKDQLLAARDAGLSADAMQLTVQELLSRFVAFEADEGRLAPGTIENHRGYATRYVIPLLGTLRAVDLGARDVDVLLEHISVCGAAVPLQVYRFLSAALKWAKSPRQKLIASIAWWADVERPRYEQQEQREELTDAQVLALWSVAMQRQDAAIWILALDRGLRSGELRGLTWPEIDWGAKVLRVRRQAQRRGGEMVLTPRLKTKNSRRDVPLSDHHLEVLRWQRTHVDQLRRVAGDAWREMGCVFPANDGRPLSPDTHHDRWRAVLNEAGIVPVDFHTTRHTAISRMLRSGVRVEDVAAIVGDTVMTIHRVYAHARVEDARPALERMDERARVVGG
jgi:integrase